MESKTFCLFLFLTCAHSLPLTDWTKYFNHPYIPWKIGTCKFNTYQTKFQPELFFTGKWHELKSFGNFLLQADSKCSTMESEMKGDQINVLSYQYEPMLSKYMYIRGSANLTDAHKAKYSIKYDFVAGLTSLQLPFTVLGTDYENYAVVYSCQEAFGFVAEMAWISTRLPGDLTHLKDIEEVVDEARLSMSDFKDQEIPKICPPNPPEL